MAGDFQKKSRSALSSLPFRVSRAPLADEGYTREQQDLLTFLHNLVLQNPELAVPEIEAALVEYPALPELRNFMYTALQKMGESERAYEAIEETVRAFPEYLFARIAYAEYLIFFERLEEIPRLFQSRFELELLYPLRDVFHISEVISFYYIMGRYYFLIGKYSKFEFCSDLLNELEEDDQRARHLSELREQYYAALYRVIISSS